MKIWKWAWVMVLLIIPMMRAEPPQQQKKPLIGLPAWAYGFVSDTDPIQPDPQDSEARGGPDKGVMLHVSGSSLSFTFTQLRDQRGPADWFPDDHPKMPDVVAHGKRPNVSACSFCHFTNGKGHPSNADITDLPYSYFLQTMSDFKNGLRWSADTRKTNTNQMKVFANAMSDDEIKAAAQYYTSIKWAPRIKVVETNMVPKMGFGGGMFFSLEGKEKEPIGQRILETPESREITIALRNPRSMFIAYAPVGSIKKGEAIVTAKQCRLCHGDQLQGRGPVPGIAGRSPSYLVRELYDMQQGTRIGEWTSLMKPAVTDLTPDDFVALGAYLASRTVPSASATSASN